MAGAGKGYVVIAAGSDSDMPHLENLAKEIGATRVGGVLDDWGSEHEPYSRSKDPEVLGFDPSRFLSLRGKCCSDKCRSPNFLTRDSQL